MSYDQCVANLNFDGYIIARACRVLTPEMYFSFESVFGNGSGTHQPYHKMLEHSQNGNKVLVVALGLAIVTSITIVYLLKEKFRKDRLMAQHTTEKRIARKLHDEIANEIYGTILFVNTREVLEGSRRQQLLDQLDAIYKSARDISRENTEVDTGMHYPIQLKLMLKMYANQNTSVVIQGLDNTNWDKAAEVQKIGVFRILQELMVNMKKHSGATAVAITFKQTEKELKVSYSDNGKGCPLNKDNANTDINLRNIKARISDINGNLDVTKYGAGGLSLSFVFPL